MLTKPGSPSELAGRIAELIVGQPNAINSIIPFVEIHEAGLAPEGRPAGVFLLLGPTGTGKTRTVEALAQALHGSPRKLLKVDCGEFQMEHEVAKLIGAPPGYLGHRETQPLLTQAKINSVTSNNSDLSLVLFDEIEKAAPSMTRLLLGVLDKATLRLGDNSVVNFEKSVIFLTSNLGARSMERVLRPNFGFETLVPRDVKDGGPKIESIALKAVRRRFSPEFVNRIDAVVTYQPLTAESLALILDQQLRDLQEHIIARLGDRSFHLEVPTRTRRFLLKRGASIEYGARELKRTIHRELLQPLARMVANHEIHPGETVRVETNGTNTRVLMHCLDPMLEPAA
ncbi:MAG TPA: AAA family ATPase [Bryobacteraceae bacterium]|nr:AAA family ATPase [Bryobacteraceae bacterium]